MFLFFFLVIFSLGCFCIWVSVGLNGGVEGHYHYWLAGKIRAWDEALNLATNFVFDVMECIFIYNNNMMFYYISFQLCWKFKLWVFMHSL